MKFRVFLFTITILTFWSYTAKSQYYFFDNNNYDRPILFEIGGSFGGMNCMTDLGGKKGEGKKFVKDWNIQNTRPCGSVYITATYMYSIAARLEVSFGSVKAYDSILKNVAASTNGRYDRNLSFRSPITEISLVTEIHPLFLFGKFDPEVEPKHYSPYVIAGIGYFSFNPQAKLGNKWVDLHPLHLEGQGFSEYPDRKEYKLQQICIPVGLGMKFELSPLLNLRTEFVYRILNTDYLDDVSEMEYVDPSVFANHLSGSNLTNALKLYDRHTDPNYIPGTSERGHPNNKDAYFTFNIKLGLTFGRQKIR